MEEAQTPALCLRIRKAREAIIDPETGKQLTQAKVAQRMGISERWYRKFETVKEPTMPQLRQIAVAQGYPEDYFTPAGNLEEATAQVVAEADRLHSLGDGLEEVLEALRSQIEETKRGQPPSEQTEEPPEPG
ncbi:MAG TPA: helix-turn-helix transcriptional regulator [Acidimicrobiales bacterium]|nr:helix-turn-helix transcriptional regulator [Acidimicrobiales bacterium]